MTRASTCATWLLDRPIGVLRRLPGIIVVWGVSVSVLSELIVSPSAIRGEASWMMTVSKHTTAAEARHQPVF